MSDKNIAKAVRNLQNYRFAKEPKPMAQTDKPVLEGISFRYKTVQFHLIDDTFEELLKDDRFGDLKIYSERFSLPGYGIKLGKLDGEEYQFEIICLIKSNTDQETYLRELKKALEVIEKKHDVEIQITPSKEFYNVNKIIFYTTTQGIFSED